MAAVWTRMAAVPALACLLPPPAVRSAPTGVQRPPGRAASRLWTSARAPWCISAVGKRQECGLCGAARVERRGLLRQDVLPAGGFDDGGQGQLVEAFLRLASLSLVPTLVATLGAQAVEYLPDVDYADPFAIPKVSTAQTIAGFILTLAIGVLGQRALKRRAERATTLQYRSDGVRKDDEIEKKPEAPPPEEASQTPTFRGAFGGAVVAGGIAFALFLFSQKVESSFAAQRVPEGYTVRNITITLRTIVIGISFLATFAFTANAVGLFLFSLQLLFKGSSEADATSSGGGGRGSISSNSTTSTSTSSNSQAANGSEESTKTAADAGKTE